MRSRKHVPCDLGIDIGASVDFPKGHSFMKTHALRVRRHAAVLAFFALIVSLCLLCIQLFYSSLFYSIGRKNVWLAPMSDAELRASLRCQSEHAAPRYGFHEPAVSSTVVMLFSSTDAYQYVYKKGTQGGAEAEGMHPVQPNSSLKRSVLKFTELDWSDAFQRVAAAFLTSPEAEHTVWDEARNHNPFFDFFQDHGATFWAIENDSVATPLQLDVVYTYVNPEAPSFRQHLAMRKVPYETERYNDWQELRYSLRSLLAYALQSTSLRQYNNQYKEQQEEDRQTLEALGYRMQLRGDESRAKEKVGHERTSLIRRIFLVLSDRDQVPAWLNVEAFPMLQIVTHAELFPDPQKEPDILPTMNSNAIESGLHRIPSLSRFFLYVNNDFMFSRQISFFDLFRPLSPPRQQLYTLRHLFQETNVSCDPPQQGMAQSQLRRRFIHLEPLFHSDLKEIDWENNYKNDPYHEQKWKIRIRQGLCLNTLRHRLRRGYVSLGSSRPVSGPQDASKTVRAGNVSAFGEVLLEMLGQPGWKTAPGFCLPKPFIKALRRAEGTSSFYYFYIMMKNFDGIQPPFALAHTPQLMDREVLARFLEKELHNLTRIVRISYERRLFFFSVSHSYGFFANAMARAATRDAWMQQTRTGMARCMLQEGVTKGCCPEAWRTWLQQTQEKLEVTARKPLVKFSRKIVPSFSDLGPVYGSTFDVQLQDPNLFRELGFWWFPEMRPSHPIRHDAKSLRQTYSIPHVSVCTFDEHNCHDSKSFAKVFTHLDDYYGALLQERFYLQFMKQSFLFHKVESPKKARNIAENLRKLAKGHKPPWIALNDDLFIDKMRKDEIEDSKVAFQEALIEATSGAPPAPWEK